MRFRDLIRAHVDGDMTLEELENRLMDLAFARTVGQEDSGPEGHASLRLDLHREQRCGLAEVVYCAGKSPDQVRLALQGLARAHGRALGTRAGQEHWLAVADLKGAAWDPVSGLITLGSGDKAEPGQGLVAVVSAGTADAPVAEEAARTAEFLGSRVVRHYDCGVAGIHRLFDRLEELRSARAVVAVAGMDGALASVVSGVVAPPVIAVPTSVGYGASFGGLAALLTMLNACAPGVGVVNIDNGFGAGYMAHVINRQSLGTP